MRILDDIKARLSPLDPIPTDCKPTGSLKEKVQCLLFDLYGTLFISGSGDIGILEKRQQIEPDLKRLLTAFNIDKEARIVHENFVQAIRQHHEEMRTTGVNWPEVRVDEIWSEVLGINVHREARAFAEAFELMTNPVYPMPHSKEVLAACQNRQIPIGIVSNAQFYTLSLFHLFFESSPESLGFESDLIFLSYRIGRAKPSPVLFQMAVDRLADSGISPRSVLYLGNDMLNDIHPAQKAGFQTALFGGDARSLRLREDDPACQHVSPDLIVTDLRQLLRFL